MKAFVFLHDRYADWEIGYILPELRRSENEVHIFGLSKNALTSGGNLRVTPELSIAEVNLAEVDLLILCGGWFWKEFHDERLDHLVRAVKERGGVVAGICAATGYLAKIGMLDRVGHTSNSVDFLFERAPNYQGREYYRKAMAVCDQNVITAGGLGAVDFTFEILKRLQVYEPKDCEDWYKAFKFGEE